MGRRIGYARVSTDDQDLTIQKAALEKEGRAIVFEEKRSGAKRDGRVQLELALKVLVKGDTLVVTRLDRLGRSLRDLANIAHEIELSGAHLRVIEQSVDTSTSAGRAFFGMLAVFAQFETDVRRERQAEGIARAKRAGIYTGGKARISRQAVPAGRRRRACCGCPRAGRLAHVGLSDHGRGGGEPIEAGDGRWQAPAPGQR